MASPVFHLSCSSAQQFPAADIVVWTECKPGNIRGLANVITRALGEEMRQHSLAPLPDGVLELDVLFHSGHALTRRQVPNYLAFCRLFWVVPFSVHKMEPIRRVEQPGMKLRARVST